MLIMAGQWTTLRAQSYGDDAGEKWKPALKFHRDWLMDVKGDVPQQTGYTNRQCFQRICHISFTNCQCFFALRREVTGSIMQNWLDYFIFLFLLKCICRYRVSHHEQTESMARDMSQTGGVKPTTLWAFPLTPSSEHSSSYQPMIEEHPLGWRTIYRLSM